jgi:hypothetical protein
VSYLGVMSLLCARRLRVSVWRCTDDARRWRDAAESSCATPTLWIRALNKIMDSHENNVVFITNFKFRIIYIIWFCIWKETWKSRWAASSGLSMRSASFFRQQQHRQQVIASWNGKEDNFSNQISEYLKIVKKVLERVWQAKYVKN